MANAKNYYQNAKEKTFEGILSICNFKPKRSRIKKLKTSRKIKAIQH